MLADDARIGVYVYSQDVSIEDAAGLVERPRDKGQISCQVLHRDAIPCKLDLLDDRPFGHSSISLRFLRHRCCLNLAFPDGTRYLREHRWHVLYSPLLIVSKALLRGKTHPAVPFSRSEPPSKTRSRRFRTESHPGRRAPYPGRHRNDHAIRRRILYSWAQCKTYTAGRILRLLTGTPISIRAYLGNRRIELAPPRHSGRRWASRAPMVGPSSRHPSLAST